jgi:hypothetical protein
MGGGTNGGNGGRGGRIAVPVGALRNIERIISDGKVEALRGITLRPLWNVHRVDGMRGVEGHECGSGCEFCEKLEKEAKTDITRTYHIEQWGKPSRENQHREVCIVHFRFYCRTLKIALCRHCETHPEDKDLYLAVMSDDEAKALIAESKRQVLGNQ